MAQLINMLVMVHGMIPDREPKSQIPTYEAFWEAIKRRQPELAQAIDRRIDVEWGHDTGAGTDLRPDEKLTAAQQWLFDNVSYDAVRMVVDPNNILLNRFPFGMDPGIPFLREALMWTRENLLIRGLGDAAYYCSTDGERQVRRVVYEQVLQGLEGYMSAQGVNADQDDVEVRLHFFTHSLGVTVTHDFLYGLFAPDHQPDFIYEEQGEAPARKLYEDWRNRAQNGTLTLGSFSSAASQIPLFLMRKQTLVDRLHNRERLNPNVIGVVPNQGVRWQLFYDIDDVLGFPTRNIYDPKSSIREIQVDVGDDPLNAHIGYWESDTVIRETAQLLLANTS